MRTEYPPDQPIVQMKGIVKHFPGVIANDRVDFDLYPGEIHTLLGENVKDSRQHAQQVYQKLMGLE